MHPAVKRKRGRPSKWSEKLAEEMCARLSTGETLASICRDAHMPQYNTVHDWRIAHPDFCKDYARARAEGFDAIAAECIEIANTPVIGKEIFDGPQGRSTKQSDMVAHRKLQIETRLKLLAKWDPCRYGERIMQEHSGQDGAPLTVKLEFVDPPKK